MPQPKDKDWSNVHKNKSPSICYLKEALLKPRDTYRPKVRGWKKIFHANRHQKKAGVAILTSDKTDFKTNTMIRDKEEHYIMMKGSIQEDITIINIYMHQHTSTSIHKANTNKYEKEISSNTIIVGNFNTVLTPMDRSTKEKISKEHKI